MQPLNTGQAPLNELAYRLLDTLNSTILHLDGKRCINYINAAGEALFECGVDSLIDRQFDDLLSRSEPSSILTNLTRDSIALTEHEAVITLASGKSIVADYSIYPFGNQPQDGEIVLEIRPFERQAQFAQDELTQLQQQATQQLARGLAHEINNPLGGIRGAAQLLQKALDRPEWTEYTEIIISEVDRLQSLTSKMLGPSNQLQRKPVNILEVLEHIRKIVQAAEPERINIQRDYDPSIPELMADRELLIQAFLNITRNAVQAIDGSGEIIFRTRVDRQFTIGRITHPLVVQVDITDNGPGIPRDLGETIFFPMVTSKPEGNGLGLPIAQEIIFRHGGTIHSQSSDSGTTFSTILPME